MAQFMADLLTKGEEAHINENLASICRTLANFMPRVKVAVEQGRSLTDADNERLRQLCDVYNANIARYKSLKGFR